MVFIMDMDVKKVELLLWVVLLDDVNNVGERLVVLSVDIKVDDDGDVWIMLDMDFWFEDKELFEVEVIVKMLWLEIDWLVINGIFLFVWLGISVYFDKMMIYFKMVLDVYSG